MHSFVRVASLAFVSLQILAACAIGKSIAGTPSDEEDPSGIIPRKTIGHSDAQVGVSDAGISPISDGEANDSNVLIEVDDGGGDSSNVNVDASQLSDSGIDGSVGSTSKPAPGEILISEIMYDPSGSEPNEEWIEVVNTTGDRKLLSGLELHTGSGRTFTIESNPIHYLEPGAYGLFVRSQSTATSVGIAAASILLDYGRGLGSTEGVLLANSSGSIALIDGATTIAEVPYAGWFKQTSPGGHSIQLAILSGVRAGAPDAWCLSGNPWKAGFDFGTPGKASDCP